MSSKEVRRIKSIISAYLLRIGIILMLLLMLILMVCGCLYIFDHLKKDKSVSTKSDNTQKNSTVFKTTQKEQTDFCVVLDPGHGGNDGGTVKGNIIEKDINLSVSLRVKDILEESNIKVVLTRTKDKYTELSQRVTVANNSKADVFVSLHCNYFEDDNSISGIECYYNNSDTIKSKKFAESIINSATLVDDIITRAAKPEKYYVLQQTTMPAVLVEMGFLSNHLESQKLADDNYQKVLAQTIADGILKQLVKN